MAIKLTLSPNNDVLVPGDVPHQAGGPRLRGAEERQGGHRALSRAGR